MSRRVAGGVVAAGVALGAGCSREVGYVASCDLSGAEPAKSANPATMRQWIDYSNAGEALSLADAKEFCADLGGVVLPGKCPLAGAMSRCRPNNPGNAEFVFYPPTVPADATHACDVMQGTLGKP